MKRIILSIALIISVMGVSAQKANVSKAEGKVKSVPPDVKAARELITPALTDPTTEFDAKTWYVAGLVGAKENQQNLDLASHGQKFDVDATGQAIITSIGYFLKADSLADLPDKKGKVKNKFHKDIVGYLKGYYTERTNLLLIYGNNLYNSKKYAESYKVWNTYLDLPDMPILAGEGLQKDSTYLEIQYYTGLAAFNAKLHKEAVVLFKRTIADNYRKVDGYQLLYIEYHEQNDTAAFVQALEDGFAAFPKEPYFLQNLINHYVFSNQSEKALQYLDNAITNEPTVAEYRYVKGALEERLEHPEIAEANFNKALELDSTLAGAYAGKGRLIFNRAKEMLDAADKIKDNKLYNAEVKKSNEVIRGSLPFFLKATELAPKEIEYKEHLQQVYYRLDMQKEYDDIVKQIKELH